MPKEAVYCREDQRRKVEVGWRRDYQYVQVASLDQVQESPDPNHDAEWAGHVVDLDRDGINTLIRTLRRARDQAFGRDE